MLKASCVHLLGSAVSKKNLLVRFKSQHLLLIVAKHLHVPVNVCTEGSDAWRVWELCTTGERQWVGDWIMREGLTHGSSSYQDFTKAFRQSKASLRCTTFVTSLKLE